MLELDRSCLEIHSSRTCAHRRSGECFKKLMMKVQRKTIYRCEYCNKLYLRIDHAQRHEAMCYHNPINHRPCLQGNCKHLSKNTTDYWFDCWSGSRSRPVNLFHCDLKKLFMYPPKVEHKKNFFDLGDEANKPMPRTCEYHCTKEIYLSDESH